MEEKEFRAIKARIAYEEYVSNLPKCDLCEKCMFVNDRKSAKRVCLLKHELIDSRILTCPIWCPKRK